MGGPGPARLHPFTPRSSAHCRYGSHFACGGYYLPTRSRQGRKLCECRCHRLPGRA